MKRTTTRETKQYSPCVCVDKSICPLCKGTGLFVSSTSIETIEEYYSEPKDELTQGAIDAEVVCGELENLSPLEETDRYPSFDKLQQIREEAIRMADGFNSKYPKERYEKSVSN